MLKFSYLAQLGLAGTVLVPAIVLKEDPASGLTHALANTRITLESLEHLHSALTRGDYSKVASSLGATESPTGAVRERDEHLAYLRNEVSRLQMRWDAFSEALSAKAPAPTTEAAPSADPSVATPAVESALAELSLPTTGMNQTARAELVQRLAAQGAPIAALSTGEKVSYEPAGFSAHAVRHGRACYKAGRYEEALAILRQTSEQAGAHFWIACSLEKLGRTEEAIAAYESVMQSPQDSKHAVHAERNRDFLIWKRDFDARISTTIPVIPTLEGK
jgi:tetratricopeptide (TPR) repeat protein